MAQQKYASFAVEDMKEGTGLFDNVDAILASLQFTKEAPENYQAEGNPIFAVVNFELAGDGPAEERRASQTYSLGAQAGDNFTISENGYALIPTNDDAAPRKDSKFGSLCASMQAEGVPSSLFKTGDFSALVGLNGHWKRIADRERSFAEQRNTKGKSKFPPSTLLLTKLIALPGEAAKPAAVGGGKVIGRITPAAGTTTAGTATTAAAMPTGDINDVTGEYLVDVLKAKGGTVQRSKLTLFLSNAAGKDPRRQDIARLGADEAFLVNLASAGVISYDPAAKPQVVMLVPQEGEEAKAA